MGLDYAIQLDGYLIYDRRKVLRLASNVGKTFHLIVIIIVRRDFE